MKLTQIKKYIFKNFYTGMAKTSVSAVLSIVAIPIIVKNIGIEKYGLISIVLLFSSFTGVLDLGLSKALISFSGKGKEKEVSAIYFINLAVFSAVILVSILIYFLNINLLGSGLSINAYELRILNTIAVLLLAFGLFNNLLRASLEAAFKLEMVNWGFMLQTSIVNGGWLLLSFFEVKIILFLLIPLLGALATIGYHLFLLPPIYSVLKKPDKNSLKSVFGVTIQFFQVGILNSIHLPLVKYAIILFIGNERAIGIFELSTKLAIFCNSALSYISNPFFSISSRQKDANTKELLLIVSKVTKILLVIAASGLLLYFTVDRLLINYFYNEYSNEIFHILTLILVGYLSVAVSEAVQKFYLGFGMIKLVRNTKLLAVLLNLVLYGVFLLMDNLSFFNLVSIYTGSLLLLSSYWLLHFYFGDLNFNSTNATVIR